MANFLDDGRNDKVSNQAGRCGEKNKPEKEEDQAKQWSRYFQLSAAPGFAIWGGLRDSNS